MKIIKVENYEKMSEKAAEIIKDEIKQNPKIILGLATGGTPEKAYESLIKYYENNEITFKDVQTFNLDEYIGIEPSHKASYRYFMDDKLFNHIDIQKANTHVPNGIANPEIEGRTYDEAIAKAGGIDLQILGIGENGHIAFNEPGSTDEEFTRKVALTASTIKANSRYFSNENDVPKFAITMGIGSILKAKKIILLASGSKKSKAIYKTIKGKISPACPASYLQNHKDVTIIIDEDASQLL